MDTPQKSLSAAPSTGALSPQIHVLRATTSTAPGQASLLITTSATKNDSDPSPSSSTSRQRLPAHSGEMNIASIHFCRTSMLLREDLTPFLHTNVYNVLPLLPERSLLPLGSAAAGNGST
jgi:hypothetical protein